MSGKSKPLWSWSTRNGQTNCCNELLPNPIFPQEPSAISWNMSPGYSDNVVQAISTPDALPAHRTEASYLNTRISEKQTAPKHTVHSKPAAFQVLAVSHPLIILYSKHQSRLLHMGGYRFLQTKCTCLLRQGCFIATDRIKFIYFFTEVSLSP